MSSQSMDWVAGNTAHFTSAQERTLETQKTYQTIADSVLDILCDWMILDGVCR